MESETAEMKREERRKLWENRIADWRASGLNQSEYCRRNGLALPQFNYWKLKCDSERGPLRLVPIQKSASPLARPNSEQGGIVIQAYGHRLEIGPQTLPESLEMVLQVLEHRSCGA